MAPTSNIFYSKLRRLSSEQPIQSIWWWACENDKDVITSARKIRCISITEREFYKHFVYYITVRVNNIKNNLIVIAN